MGAQESCGRTWHTFRICLLARYLILWYAGGPAKIFPTVFFPGGESPALIASESSPNKKLNQSFMLSLVEFHGSDGE
ncbi:hypothetical protein WN943_002571 [Citrus x changshan-huyou]